MSFVHYTITEEELNSLYPQNRLAKRSIFVAKNEDDILSCIGHYTQRKVAFPPFRQEALAFDSPKLNILLEYTMASNHRLEIPILPEVSFHVNPNGWTSFKDIAQNFHPFQRGPLYKWDTGNTAYSEFYFLDRNIMEALSRHDLGPYEDQMKAWMEEDNNKILLAESEGLIGRLPGHLRAYDGDKE